MQGPSPCRETLVQRDVILKWELCFLGSLVLESSTVCPADSPGSLMSKQTRGSGSPPPSLEKGPRESQNQSSPPVFLQRSIFAPMCLHFKSLIYERGKTLLIFYLSLAFFLPLKQRQTHIRYDMRQQWKLGLRKGRGLACRGEEEEEHSI